jgi:hypothetical protein
MVYICPLKKEDTANFLKVHKTQYNLKVLDISMALEILTFHGSTLTLLIIAIIAVVALAIFRLLIPLIIAGIIVVVLLILIFGGIPIPSGS